MVDILVLKNDLVENGALLCQELVHLHFHLAELFGLGQKLGFGSSLEQTYQLVNVCRELCCDSTEIQLQILKNLLVNDLRHDEDLGANVGRLIARAKILKISALLLEIPKILRQAPVEFVMIVVNEHLSKLYRVQVVPVFDLRNLVQHEGLPDFILEPLLLAIILGLEEHCLS